MMETCDGESVHVTAAALAILAMVVKRPQTASRLWSFHSLGAPEPHRVEAVARVSLVCIVKYINQFSKCQDPGGGVSDSSYLVNQGSSFEKKISI